ncbi:MAG: class I SAM-dependent methyltransferase [Actinomycetota bacterium]
MKTLERHGRDWEDLAAADPLWAILAGPDQRGGRWDTGKFFATGEQEIAELIERVQKVGGLDGMGRALDFGCGVGRLTRALGTRFDEAVGVDISEEMVRLAGELNSEVPGCTFVVNTEPDLSRFEASSFDLVYTTLVLQHLPRRELLRAYLSEFVRILRPGGLAVFQTLARLPLPLRLQPRRRAYSVLRRVGVPGEVLLNRLQLTPTRLLAISEADVRATVDAAGGKVELVEEHPKRTDGILSLRYYVRPA